MRSHVFFILGLFSCIVFAAAARAQSDSDVKFQLLGLYDNGDHFTARIKVSNESGQQLGLAIYQSAMRPFSGEAYLRDDAGGECQAISNGENPGSLSYVNDGGGIFSSFFNHFALVSAGDDSIQTILFWKRRCTSQITNGESVTLDGDFLVSVGGNISHRSLSWTGPIVVR